jgi:hypothetical protein
MRQRDVFTEVARERRIRRMMHQLMPQQREHVTDPVIFIHRQEVKLPTTWRKAMHVSLFQPTTVEYGDRKVRDLSLICGKCGNVGKVPMNSFAHGMIGDDDKRTDQLAMRKFSQLGWVIGKQATRHRCPQCEAATKPLAAALVPLKKKEEASMPASNGSASHEPPHVEPPQQMTRDDKRVIFAKLQDVYINEVSGYSAQWTDKRVAEDLGVPLAWVSSIREENFGPDHNGEFIEQLAYARAVVEDVKQLHRDLEQLRMRHQGEIDALVARVKPMLVVMEKTERTIAGIEKAMVP